MKVGDLGSQSWHFCDQNGLVQRVRRQSTCKEAALLGLCPVCWGQGGGPCATCGPLRGVCKHGLGCETLPGPYQQGKGNLEVSQPPPREQRVPPTQPSPLDLRGEAPRSSGPSWETGLHGPWGQVPLPGCSAARYSVPVRRQTWAFPAVGKDLGPARPLPPRTSCFPDPGRAAAPLCLL